MSSESAPAVTTPSTRRARAPEAVLLGEAIVAFLATDGLPLRDSTAYRRSVVGAELNVATGLARLGHDVLFCGRTGTDPLGQVVLDAVRARGVEPALVADPAPTAVLVRDVSPSRPTEVSYARAGSAGSRLSPDDLPRDALATTRLLHVSGITATLSETASDACRTAAATVRAAGGTVAFDPNVRRRFMDPVEARRPMLDVLGLTTILLTGLDELGWLSGLQDADAAVAWALDLGVEQVVVKDGARGAWARDRDGTLTVAVRPVHAVDPVGAGDAFAAGFLSAVLRGAGTEQALAEGAAVAALVVATAGDVEGLPDRDLLDRFLSSGADVRR